MMPNVKKTLFHYIVFPTNAPNMIKTTLKQKPIKSWFHTCSLENIKYYWMKEVTQELGRTERSYEHDVRYCLEVQSHKYCNSVRDQ